jgi:hypothetical protein
MFIPQGHNIENGKKWIISCVVVTFFAGSGVLNM